MDFCSQEKVAVIEQPLFSQKPNVFPVSAQWQMINVSSGAQMAAKAKETLDYPETILIYPNPANEVLNIRLEDMNGTAVANIFNISGHVV